MNFKIDGRRFLREPNERELKKDLKFEHFKNAFPGSKIIVCGLGESLNFLTDPRRFCTIGCNDIGRMFDPTFLINVNNRTQYKGDRFSYIEKTTSSAIFTHQPGEQGNPNAPIVTFALGDAGGVEVIENRVPHYRNTPYMGVVLAAYMGARKIGLLGVDFTDGHFWTDDGPHRLANQLPQIDKAYGNLAKHLKTKGVALLNLSPVSRLTSIRKQKAVFIDEQAYHRAGQSDLLADGENGAGIVDDDPDWLNFHF